MSEKPEHEDVGCNDLLARPGCGASVELATDTATPNSMEVSCPAFGESLQQERPPLFEGMWRLFAEYPKAHEMMAKKSNNSEIAEQYPRVAEALCRWKAEGYPPLEEWLQQQSSEGLADTKDQHSGLSLELNSSAAGSSKLDACIGEDRANDQAEPTAGVGSRVESAGDAEIETKHLRHGAPAVGSSAWFGLGGDVTSMLIEEKNCSPYGRSTGQHPHEGHTQALDRRFH